MCGRTVPKLSSHHLVPKARGGARQPTLAICPDCHDAIHEMFSNRDLGSRYRSVEALLADERFARHVRWLSRQSPERRFPSHRVRERRGKGR